MVSLSQVGKLNTGIGQGRLIIGGTLTCTELQCSGEAFLVGKFLNSFNQESPLDADTAC